MKMEEFQTMMEDQEEFEGESILEDFEDFVMGFNFFRRYLLLRCVFILVSHAFFETQKQTNTLTFITKLILFIIIMSVTMKCLTKMKKK